MRNDLIGSGMNVRSVNIREILVVEDTMQEVANNLMQLARTNRDQVESLNTQARAAVEMAYGYGCEATPDTPRKPFIYSDGVAVVPIHGTLLNRFPYSWGFATGYAFIRSQIAAIKADLASDGGDVSQVVWDAELSTLVPTLAYIDSLAASGGYALACTANKVVSIPSATIGSIGVYRLHIDLSGALNQAGVKYTFVQAGDEKTDGNMFQPLSDRAKTKWQDSANKTWQTFIDFVATNRGIDPEVVRTTQGSCMRADEALDINLIDGVSTATEAVNDFLAECADGQYVPSDDDDGDEDMTTPAPKPEVASAPTAAAPSATDLASLVASAVGATMARMGAIQNSPEGLANPKLANHLAYNTTDTAEACIATLKVAGPAAVAKPEEPKTELNADGTPKVVAIEGKVDEVNHLANAMGQIQTPKTPGAGSEGKGPVDGQKTDADITSTLLADYSAMSGRKFPSQTAQ